MEFVSGGELMSLIVKERGFGEKRSWYASQCNLTAEITVAFSNMYFREHFNQVTVILDLNLEKVLGETN